jgi:hypothetical protein
LFVALNRERLCEEVCDVVETRNVMHRELLLLHAINNAVESHVHTDLDILVAMESLERPTAHSFSQ